MGFLAGLSRQKANKAEIVAEVKSKTDLRLYLESLIDKAKTIETGSVKIAGLPVNPVLILPMISAQLSDEMLENVADMVLVVAADINKMRESRVNQNEIIADSTEFQS